MTATVVRVLIRGCRPRRLGQADAKDKDLAVVFQLTDMGADRHAQASNYFTF